MLFRSSYLYTSQGRDLYLTTCLFHGGIGMYIWGLSSFFLFFGFFQKNFNGFWVGARRTGNSIDIRRLLAALKGVRVRGVRRIKS